MITSNYYTDITEKNIELSKLRNILNAIIDISYYDGKNRRIIISEKDLNSYPICRDILKAIKNKEEYYAN